MLHQIWFDLGKGKTPPSPNGMASMQVHCKPGGLAYKLWSESDATDVINSMPARIQQLWHDLPHQINRIDLFRYILMYKFGGIYFDVDFHCIQDLSRLLIDDTILLCEEWPYSYKNGSLHNGVLISKSSKHAFWLNIIHEIESRLHALKQSDHTDIQASVFKLTGTSMLRDVAHQYLKKRNLFNRLVIMPFGVFCPLVCEDGTYLDSYGDTLDRKTYITQKWSVPSGQLVTKEAKSFTVGFLGASVKIWQQSFPIWQQSSPG